MIALAIIPAPPATAIILVRDGAGPARSKPLSPPAAKAGLEGEVDMASYCYEAVDAGGLRNQGMLDVTDQGEALKRIKEMGLFPTRVTLAISSKRRSKWNRVVPRLRPTRIQLPRGTVRPAALTVFTRQLATLIDVGMPLMRGLRILQQQADNRALKGIILDLAAAIEGGSSLSEALARHPKVFSPLYVNMVKAGELGGVLEAALRRQAEFMEKSLKIKGRIRAALFYPAAVMTAAAGVLALMMVFIIPRFQEVFVGLLGGRPMPPFTVLVLNISELFRSHYLTVGLTGIALGLAARTLVRTRWGRPLFDRGKLALPVVGRVVRRVILARFARTLGTLLGSGVPVLPALAIVRETAGNAVMGGVVSRIHASVKEGGTIAAPLQESQIFPAMVAGMVDVGEQTGALPDMLLRIADTCDEEVDNAVNALTSLLEPIMIVFLAVIVGSIVIAMFLPIISVLPGSQPGGDAGGAGL
jgi:type IV pilus assembly protein PilC